jgi:hypothetical protein
MHKALAVLSLAALIGVAAVSSLQAEPAVPESVSAEAAALSGKGAPALHRPVTPSFEPDEPFEDFVDSQNGDEYWVEKETDRIRYYSNRAAYPASGRKDIGVEAITAQADELLPRVCPEERRDRMVRYVERLVGGDEISYVVEFREYIGDVRTFNYVIITLAPDGEVANVSVQDYDVTVALRPSVSRDSAAKTLAQSAGFALMSTEDSELVVHRSVDGVQRLCWEVKLETGSESFGSKAWGLIDARTGVLVDHGVSD